MHKKMKLISWAKQNTVTWKKTFYHYLNMFKTYKETIPANILLVDWKFLFKP